MELIVNGSFYRDIAAYTNHNLLEAVYATMNNVENAKSKASICQLIKLRQYKIFYRIKIANDYRIGIIIRKNTVWFVRFGHRSTFYKYFP
jgi:mRNA-degrading endonuclease RelE of RelBE toxin-antitoxin system